MTGDKRTNFADKRHLPQERFQAGFFDYLADELLAVAHHLWGSRRGVFGIAEFDGDGAGKFKVDNLPKEFLDGDGHILAPTTSDATQISVQNTLGIAYYVGAKHCLIPSGVARNPRTGHYDYDLLEDRIGVVDEPDSVVEGSGTLTVTVDSVFETGVSHAGRHVTVWHRRCKSGDPDVAIERDLVVSYVGGHNVVTTSGLLGQPGGSASTVPADYQVAATGLTVRRNTDLRSQAAYAFLTILTGTGGAIGPADFNSADQINVTSGLTPSLDTAYDGSLGSGSGRVVSVDGGAVDLRSTGASSGDVDRAALRVSRIGSSEACGIAAELIARESDGVTLAGLRSLTKTGNVLLAQENCQVLAGGSLDLTRGGSLDLTAAGLSPACDLARVDGTATSDGLYLLSVVVDLNTVTLRQLDGTAWSPSGYGETGEVTFLRPLGWAAGPGFASSAPRSEGLRGALSVGHNGDGMSGAAHRFLPGGVASSAEFFDVDGHLPVLVERYGRIARPHRWAEDFGYHTTRWTSAATCPQRMGAAVLGTGAGGDIKMKGGIPAPHVGGICEIIAGDVVNDNSYLLGPDMFVADTDRAFLRLFARAALIVPASGLGHHFVGIQGEDPVPLPQGEGVVLVLVGIEAVLGPIDSIRVLPGDVEDFISITGFDHDDLIRPPNPL